MASADEVRASGTAGTPASPVPLTPREREILSSLAEGLSGAQIAEQLVLSPETVRTHVRNAMAKLGASTRSQAVALALRQHEIKADPSANTVPEPPAPQPAAVATPPVDPAAALQQMLHGLVSLYDVDGGAVYLADEDGLSLHRTAYAKPAEGDEADLPAEVALGDGTLGRAALERRAQLLHVRGGERSRRGAVIAAPMISGSRLLGVIALAARASRPIGRTELLLLTAFASRVGEVIAAGTDVERRLERAMQRFQASWSGAPRVA